MKKALKIIGTILLGLGVLLFLVPVSAVHASTTTVTFNTSGTWTAPVGVTSISVNAYGAGGGASASSAGGGGGFGGGGGAYSGSTLTVVPGTIYNLTVGIGGTGGVPFGAAATAGGDSMFESSSTILAKGGSGGILATSGTGGQASSGFGTTKFSGGNGAGDGSADGCGLGNGPGGGGGGGAGTGGGGGAATAASGTCTAGTGGTGTAVGGGDGGRGSTGGATVANAFGGGGGGPFGGGNTGYNGAAGEVDLTYTNPVATTQVLVGSSGLAALNATTARFIDISDSNAPTTADTGANMRGMFTTSGTFSSLYAHVTTAPPGASTWTVQVFDNQVGTSVTCVISNPNTSCSDLTDSFSIAQGDNIDVEFTPSGTPTAAVGSASGIFTPTASGQTVLPLYSLESTLTTGSGYGQFNGSANTASLQAIEASSTSLLPEGGTIENMMNHLATAAGTGITNTLTVRDALSNTIVTCSVSGASTKICNDLTHTATASTGDVLDLGYVISGGTAAASRMQSGITYIPTNSGDYIFTASNHTTADTNGTNYINLSGDTLNSGEGTIQSVSNAQTITKLQVLLPQALTGSQTKTFTLRDNGVSTSLTCTVPNSGTSCNATGSVKIAAGDLLDTLTSNTGSAGGMKDILVSYIGNDMSSAPTLHANVFIGNSTGSKANVFMGNSTNNKANMSIF